jgi:death-on-curing protein
VSLYYLHPDDVRTINLAFCGDGAGVRDEPGFLSAVYRPQATFMGADLFPSFHEKAAVYLHGFATTQTLTDGNKRTGFLSATVFLEIHGYTWIGPNVDAAEDFLLAVADKRVPLEDVTAWLRSHCSDRVRISRRGRR